MIITIEAQKRKLGLEEISGAAADFLFSSNELIAERSASRVKATVEAVKSVDTEALQKLGSLNNPHQLGTMLLFLDLIGKGGHRGMGSDYGGGTSRIPLFSKLGAGRWFARDGGAYHSAAKAALIKCLQDEQIFKEEAVNLDAYRIVDWEVEAEIDDHIEVAWLILSVVIADKETGERKKVEIHRFGVCMETNTEMLECKVELALHGAMEWFLAFLKCVLDKKVNDTEWTVAGYNVVVNADLNDLAYIFNSFIDSIRLRWVIDSKTGEVID